MLPVADAFHLPNPTLMFRRPIIRGTSSPFPRCPPTAEGTAGRVITTAGSSCRRSHPPAASSSSSRRRDVSLASGVFIHVDEHGGAAGNVILFPSAAAAADAETRAADVSAAALSDSPPPAAWLYGNGGSGGLDASLDVPAGGGDTIVSLPGMDVGAVVGNAAFGDTVTAAAADHPAVAAAGGVALLALLALAVLQVLWPSSVTSADGAAAAPAAAPASEKTTGGGSAPTTAVMTTSATATATEARTATVADEFKNEAQPTRPRDADGDDDLTSEEGEALRSFEGGDRGGLLASVARLTARVRAARVGLREEQALRQDTELRLAEAAEEIRTLEDQYELGQNSLAATERRLDEARSELGATRGELQRTVVSLQELQQERQSLRKLGRAAFELSKQRVTSRIRKLRGKENGEEPDR